MLAECLDSAAIISDAKLPMEQTVQFQRAVSSNQLLDDKLLDHVAYPSTQQELGKIVQAANCNNWQLLSLGNGSKLGWGGLRSGAQLAVSTTHLNRLVDHAVGDMTVTVESGMRLLDLQHHLSKAGQWLPVDPLYGDYVTIGGMIATADTGSLRHRYGGIRDLLIGVSFIRSDGQLANAGGRVVKNVAGYDLMKLLTGSYGTLGIIAQATFRLYPLPEASQSIMLIGTADSITNASQTLLGSALMPITVDLLSSGLVKSLGLGTDMALLVRFQGLLQSVTEQSDRLLDVANALGLSSQVFIHDEDVDLWQRLQVAMDCRTPPRLLCKLGIRPTEAVNLLADLEAMPESRAIVHAASGVGRLWVAESVTIEALMAVRSRCQAAGGYLSILEAPVATKEQIDVWGYDGNALEVMRRLKQQFDPSNVLNSGCFVGGL